jgi:hypothetical protein
MSFPPTIKSPEATSLLEVILVFANSLKLVAKSLQLPETTAAVAGESCGKELSSGSSTIGGTGSLFEELQATKPKAKTPIVVNLIVLSFIIFSLQYYMVELKLNRPTRMLVGALLSRFHSG